MEPGAALPAGLGDFLQRVHHRITDRPGEVGAPLRERGRRIHDLPGNHDSRGPGKRRIPGQHLVGDDPQGVEIAAGVDLFAGRLLRTHVGRSTHHRVGAGRPLASVHQPRDAEIGEQGPGRVGRAFEDDVLRLEVAMHHAGAGRGIHRSGDLAGDGNGERHRKPSLPLEPLPQGFALEEIHDVVEMPFALPGGVHRHDVGVTDPRDQTGLRQKARGEGPVHHQLGVNDLDRDPALQGQIGGQEDHPHTPTTDFALQAVLPAQGALHGLEEIRFGHPVASITSCFGREGPGSPEGAAGSIGSMPRGAASLRSAPSRGVSHPSGLTPR